MLFHSSRAIWFENSQYACCQLTFFNTFLARIKSFESVVALSVQNTDGSVSQTRLLSFVFRESVPQRSGLLPFASCVGRGRKMAAGRQARYSSSRLSVCTQHRNLDKHQHPSQFLHRDVLRFLLLFLLSTLPVHSLLSVGRWRRHWNSHRPPHPPTHQDTGLHALSITVKRQNDGVTWWWMWWWWWCRRDCKERWEKGKRKSREQQWLDEEKRVRMKILPELLHKHVRRENAWNVTSMWLQYTTMWHNNKHGCRLCSLMPPHESS